MCNQLTQLNITTHIFLINPFQLIPNLDTPSRDRFRYTINSNGILNDRQRQFYEENGFLVIPNLVKNDLIDECQQRFLDIVDGKVEKGKKRIDDK